MAKRQDIERRFLTGWKEENEERKEEPPSREGATDATDATTGLLHRVLPRGALDQSWPVLASLGQS